jgi:hypothetical protein
MNGFSSESTACRLDRLAVPGIGGTMFLGHFGLGFAGKGLAPAASLGTLFLAIDRHRTAVGGSR